MEFYFFIIAIIALLIGSFLNVLIYRLPREESIIWPGSHCPECNHALGLLDLFPVFSYLWLMGKCRYCKASIPFRYPLVEIITAVTFLIIFINYGISIVSLSGWILTLLLIAASFIDLDYGIIPDRITYPGIIIGIIFSFFTVGAASSLLGMILFGGILFATMWLSNGGMGGGDVKLAALIGAFCGLQGAMLAFILSSLLGGLWAIVILASRKGNRKTAIKYGPFLAIAGWVVFIYGQYMISSYLSLF